MKEVEQLNSPHFIDLKHKFRNVKWMSQDDISNKIVDLEQDTMPLDSKFGAIKLYYVASTSPKESK